MNDTKERRYWVRELHLDMKECFDAYGITEHKRVLITNHDEDGVYYLAEFLGLKKGFVAHAQLTLVPVDDDVCQAVYTKAPKYVPTPNISISDFEVPSERWVETGEETTN
jgi:hypothetical protein